MLISAPQDSLPIDTYMAELAGQGVKVIKGEGDTYWVANELGSLIRYPKFCTAPVSKSAIQCLFNKTRAGIVNYVIDPNDDYPANSYVYTCNTYDVSTLCRASRWNARYAFKKFAIGFMNWSTILEHGVEAFCDTRARAGLSDGTTQQFKNAFDRFSENRSHFVIGAWAVEDRMLAGFLPVIVVDKWADIGSFSSNRYLKFRPSNGLIHYALDYFLLHRGLNVVSYGVSSVQKSSMEGGLHEFKLRVGFEAKHVHRAFVFHPLLRPLANRWTLRIMQTALKIAPHNRLLKKGVGSLATSLAR